jgi:glyoxylase-like metal-dependent hydrolase (beta-lactamase superfamily II)
MKIIENVYVIPRVMANSYLLVEPDGLTIIDTGMPFSEKRIMDYIRNLGKSVQDIKRILITHADLDHYGCLAALQSASGACTSTGRIEAEAIAAGKSSRPVNRYVGRFQRIMIGVMGKLLKPTPFQVHEILSEGQVLPVLGGLQVVETPGHSPGHLSYFAPSAGVLFCGDSMRSDGRGFRGSHSRNNWDQSLADASVRKQAQLGAQIVCSGHGPAVYDAGEKFPKIIRSLGYL